MKTVFALLLLPILVLAQPQQRHQEVHLNLELSTDPTMESTQKEDISVPDSIEDTIELIITVEVYFEEILFEKIPQLIDYKEVVTSLPKYLNTLSLSTGFDSDKKNAPQERLDSLLALNDPNFPKENTFLGWLQPVKHQQNKLDSVVNVPLGFGPRISL